MKTRIILIVMLAFLGLSKVTAQIPSWQWIKTAECSNNTGGEGWNMASDADGNVYLTGYYNGSITFGTDTLYNTGYYSVFLAKYNSHGDVIWAKTSVTSGTGIGVANGIATDVSGNIFITGNYENDSISFGTFNLANTGVASIFLVKYDSSGSVLWANGIGGNAYGYGVATDATGNCYITGYYQDLTLTFGIHSIMNNGTQNIFIAKYDPNGIALWAKNAGGNGADIGYAIASDAVGTIYVTGSISSPIAHFGQDSINNPMGELNFFLAKYDSSGNVIWVKNSKGNLPATAVKGYSVAIDPQENIFATGYFGYAHDTILFGIDTLAFSGNIDGHNVFIVKYDSSGNAIWAKNGYGIGYSVISDSLGNAYISGGIQHNDSLDIFDTVTLHIPSGSFEPMFIVKYNPAGHALYGFAMDGGGDDNNALAKGPSGSVYVGGDLDNNRSPYIWGNDTLVMTGGEVPFVAKLGFNNIETTTHEIKPQQSIILSPNPFATSTTLTLQGTYHNPSLFIYNLLGQEVRCIPVGTNTQITIPRNQLPTGMYFYKVIEDNKEVLGIGKIIIE
jgi:hypothetical protein